MSYNAPPPPPPMPPGSYGAPGGGYAMPKNSTKAIWALVLGILGLLCCGFIAGIPAVVLGKQAQGEIDGSGGMLTGRGMATAGFVLGIIAIIWGVVYVILLITGTLNFGGSFSSSS